MILLNDKAILPAFERNNVPVILASSNLYAPYAGVFIQSLLDHASEENNYDIIIFNREISEENKRLLKHLAAGYTNVSVRFYDPSPLFASFHYVDAEHFWLELYFRIVAPHILNYHGRIITVGLDTLLKADIARLMDEELEGCCVGGVSNAPDIYANCLYDRVSFSRGNIAARDYWQDREIYDWKNWESYKNHINGDLLLIDCDKYVQEADMETILNAAWHGNVLWADEHIVNSLMKGKIRLLNVAWNVMLPLNARAFEHLNIVSKIYSEIYNGVGVFEQAYENPYLLQWVNKPKPWVCPDVPYGSEWWQTAMRTPFVGHIIARMFDAQENRREYYRKRYGKEVDVWDPSPKGIDRT